MLVTKSKTIAALATLAIVGIFATLQPFTVADTNGNWLCMIDGEDYGYIPMEEMCDYFHNQIPSNPTVSHFKNHVNVYQKHSSDSCIIETLGHQGGTSTMF